MIIQPETSRKIISPMEEVEESALPSESFVAQAKIVIESSGAEKDVMDYELETLKIQNINQIRNNAQLINSQKATENFTALLQQNTSPDFVATSLKVLSEKQERNKTALEEEVINVLSQQSFKNPVQRYINENDRGFIQNLNEVTKKELAVYNKIEEIRSKGDGYDTGLNFLTDLTFLGFIQRTLGFGLTDYSNELRSLATRLENANSEDAVQILDESEKLIKATQILGDNPRYVEAEFGEAFTGSIQSQRLASIFNAIDFVDTAFIAGGVLKGVTILPKRGLNKAALDLGDTDTVAKDIVNSKNKIVNNPVDGVGLASGLKTQLDESDGLSAAVRKEYEVNQRVLNSTLDKFSGMDYSEVQALDIVDNLKDRLKKEFSNGSITDMKLRSDGQVDITLLSASGNAYKTERGAKTSLTKRGLTGEVFQMNSGGWATKVNVPALDAQIANLSTKGITALTRFLRRPEAWVDDQLLVQGQIAEGALGQITSAGQSVFDNTLGKLDKKQINNMLPILDYQRAVAKGETNLKPDWLTPKEIDIQYRSLYGRPVTVKEMNAFNGYRLLNDFQYELDNRILYSKKKAKGFGTLDKETFGVEEINAKLATDFTKNDYIYLNDKGVTLDKTNLPKDFLKKYDVVEVDDINRLTDSKGFAAISKTPTPYIAVPKGSVEIKPLDSKQLKYLSGGRVRYDESTVFLKQANVGKYANGKNYRKTDRTLFSASSFPQAKREAEAMNSLNSILRKGVDNPAVRKEAEDFLSQRLVLGTDNLEVYLEKLTSKGFDKNEDIVPVRNRDMIKRDDLPSEFMGDMDFQQVANGRLSARGEDVVEHVDPDSSTLLNAVASLNQNFAAVANNAAFGAYRDYTLSYLERYRRFLKINPDSPRIDLLNADIKEGTNLTKAQINRIKGEQQFAREVVGKKTPEEIAADRDVEKGVEWALGSKMGDIIWGDKDKLTGKLSTSLGQDPIGKIRGLVFNAKLGLFSLPAMMIQAIHAPAIAMLAPKHGFKALLTYPILRTALLSRDPQVIAEFAKKAEKLGLKGYGDLNKFFYGFKAAGLDNFGSNMVYENAARGDNLLKTLPTKVAEKGRIFFEEGELVPRMTAYATSVREWIANTNNINPKGLDIDNKDAQKYIIQRTGTLTLGLTRADIQQGLKGGQGLGGGLVSLLGQFQSYPMRALDAILFPSKGLTGAERARLAASYLVLYGSAGLPFMDMLADKITESTRDESSDKATYKFLYNGIIDGFVMATTGENTNFASRGGLGDWTYEIIKSLSGSDKSFLEVIAGPAGSTGSGAVDTLVQYAKAYKAGFNPDMNRLGTKALLDVAKQVSSFNNVYRAWFAWQTGKIYDSRGNQFIELSNVGNILQIFGVPPQAYQDIGMIYGSKEKRKQIIKLNTELMLELHNEFARTQDSAVIEKINMVAAAVAQDGLSDEVNPAVVRALKGSSTHNRLIQESLGQKQVGEKGAVPLEIEVLND